MASVGPGDPGWFGPEWERDQSGGLLPSVQITSFPGDVDLWIEVSVQGLGVEFGYSMGPYATEAVPFSVPIDLPKEANGAGLVQVRVLVAVTDPKTGDEKGHEQTAAAYVAGAGLDGATWYDQASAEAKVVRAVPIELEAGTELDGLVGLEVKP